MKTELEVLATEVREHIKDSDRRYVLVSEEIKTINHQLKSLSENKVSHKQFWAIVSLGLALISFLLNNISAQIADIKTIENKHFDYMQLQLTSVMQDVSNLKGKLEPYSALELIK